MAAKSQIAGSVVAGFPSPAEQFRHLVDPEKCAAAVVVRTDCLACRLLPGPRLRPCERRQVPECRELPFGIEGVMFSGGVV